MAVAFPLFVVMRLSRFCSQFFLMPAHHDLCILSLLACNHAATYQSRCDGLSDFLGFAFCTLAHDALYPP